MLSALGKRIKALRTDRGLTLEQLATRADLSAGFLSQLERGLGNPSFTTLTSLARALGVNLGHLLELAESGIGQVVTKDQRPQVTTQAGNVNYLLTPDTNRSFEVLMGEVAPLGTDEHDAVDGGAFRHPGEEFMFVLTGRIRLRLGDETHELSEGDSITFPGSIPHVLINPTQASCEVLIVMCPPAF